MPRRVPVIMNPNGSPTGGTAGETNDGIRRGLGNPAKALAVHRNFQSAQTAGHCNGLPGETIRMASRPITAKTAWYDFVLDGIEASEVTYANDVLTVMNHQGKTAKRLAARDIAGIDIEEGPLRNGLTVTSERGQAVKTSGLQKKESEQIRRSLVGRICQLQAEEERRLNQEAAEKAEELKPEINSPDKHLGLVFNGQKFIRQSETTELAGSIRKLTNRLDARVRGQLDQAGRPPWSASTSWTTGKNWKTPAPGRT